MRSPSSRLRDRPGRVPLPAILPVSMLTMLGPALLAAPASAQEKAAPPITLTITPPPTPSQVPTVPVPPPEPPARPDALRTLLPAGDTPPKPILDAPAPPERPPDLTVPAQTGRPAEPAADTAPAAPLKPAAPPAPLPPARPDELRTLLPAGDAPPKPILDAPTPPERPAELSPQPPSQAPSPAPSQPLPSPEAPLPPERPAELSGESGRKLTLDAPEDAACLGRLAELGVDFEKREAIVNGQCSVAHPLSVSGVGGGIVLRPEETMVCRVTEALALWRIEVQAVAKAELDDSLEGLTSAGAYVCRGQNHDVEAQLSDHAFANAIDISGFTFANRKPITVGTWPEGSKEAAFLAAVRAKACTLFSTVLGPGSNEAHATHLHLDTRERSNGYRICE